MVLLLLLLILAPIVYLWWTQNERFKLGANIPGPKPYPIVGNTFSFLFIKSEGTTSLVGLWSAESVTLIRNCLSGQICSR